MSLDSKAIREQFPFLRKKGQGQEVAYLDSAATTQKPDAVLQSLQHFYMERNANVNRGMHLLAEEATVAYDDARATVARFIGAKHTHEVIFTRNATESINLVARSFGKTLQKGDRIALSLLEHHSNIVPWMQLAERRSLDIDWIELEKDGRLNLESFKKILKKGNTKLVSVTGLSNVLGIRTPLEEIITLAHDAGAKVMVDAAQLIAHESIDVQKLDCDFLAFSGHKIYGPTGTGVLYGRQALLDAMSPFLGGGDMLESVDRSGFVAAELPRKFEAGTPAIADAVALGEAIRWMESIGIDEIHAHGKELVDDARSALQNISDVTVLGPEHGDDLLGCVSFTVQGIHPHDLTDMLGKNGICLRAGHQCAMPLHTHLGIPASTRLSVGVYNMAEEIDRCIDTIRAVQKKFEQ